MKEILCSVGEFTQIVKIADSFSERLFGLLFRDPKKNPQPLYFPYCNSIHTIGMRHPLDLVFVNEKNGIVVRVDRNVPNGKLWIHCGKATGVLEIFSRHSNHAIQSGDYIVFKPLNDKE